MLFMEEVRFLWLRGHSSLLHRWCCVINSLCKIETTSRWYILEGYVAGKYHNHHKPPPYMSRKRASEILHFFNFYITLQDRCKEGSSSRSELKNGSWQTKTQWVVVGVSYPRLIRFWYHFALVWELNWKKFAKLILVKSILRDKIIQC